MGGRLAVVVAVLTCLLQVALVHLQICTNTVTLSTVRLEPSPFNGIASIQPNVGTCVRERIGIVCEIPNVLTDNSTGPQQPDIFNANDNVIKQFVAWSSSNQASYLTLVPPEPSPASVSTIDIYTLNNPRNGISVPNFELYGLENTVTDTPASTDPKLDVDIINNNELTLEDNNVRRITLRIRSPASHNAYLLKWNFDKLLNVSMFMISEVLLCNDPLPVYNTSTITFKSPITDKTIITPQSELLNNGSIMLTCTVSNEGQFMWRWIHGVRTVADSEPGTSILSADGTRTSVLITPVSASDSSFLYSCDASFTILTGYSARTFEIPLPSVLTSESVVTGYVVEGSVTLLCQVQGYFNGQVTFMWKRGTNVLTNTPKYSTGYSQELVSSNNGFNLTAITLSLTIQNLNTGDEGNYTCVINGGQTEAYTISLVTSLQSRETTGTQGVVASPSSTTTTGNTGLVVGIIVALVVFSIAVVAAIIIILIILRGHRKMKYSHSFEGEVVHHNRVSKTDIKWDVPLVVNGINRENEIDGLYASISKERPPSLPSRHDDEDRQQVPPEVPTNNEYAEIRTRTMTNATAPNLAKLKMRPESFGLARQDQNPIYESSEGITSRSDSKERLLKSSLTASDDSGLYALPIRKKEPKHEVDESSSNIYSESLTPAMFHQTDSTPDNNLSPYGPIYAEPTKAIKNSNVVQEVSASNYREVGHLGVGQFGEVILAETVGLSEKDLALSSDQNNDVSMKVAIKKLQEDANASIRENFEKEITFMGSLKDNNIIRLLAVGRGEDPFIMMEYMENGDLHQLLNDYSAISKSAANETGKGRPIHVSLLVYAALQISSGMKYLASRNCVHRDLATRNCLVNDSFDVKIGDFGMSRKLYDRAYYKVRGRAMLPIRWMAFESFYGKFSEKTDVWSFGVVVWEIFTLCRLQPYSDIDDQDFIKDAIKGGGRQLLQRPKDCPKNVYDVMLRCWEEKSQSRASFSEIYKMLSIIHQEF